MCSACATLLVHALHALSGTLALALALPHAPCSIFTCVYGAHCRYIPAVRAADKGTPIAPDSPVALRLSTAGTGDSHSPVRILEGSMSIASPPFSSEVYVGHPP